MIGGLYVLLKATRCPVIVAQLQRTGTSSSQAPRLVPELDGRQLLSDRQTRGPRAIGAGLPFGGRAGALKTPREGPANEGPGRGLGLMTALIVGERRDGRLEKQLYRQ